MASSNNRTDAIRRLGSAGAPQDPVLRRRIHGPIQPMERPSILRRLLGHH
ncbi:MAG TPA: hypothetical protein VMQ93_17695 [Novosphingobium sp.]|nr:hypothetical protein [Novosphingobium sp.]